MTKFYVIAAAAVVLGLGSLGVSKFVGFASSVNDELSGKKVEQSAPLAPKKDSGSKKHQLQPYQESAQVLPKAYVGGLVVAEQLSVPDERSSAAVRKVRRTRATDPISSAAYASLFKVLQKVSPSKMASTPSFRL